MRRTGELTISVRAGGVGDLDALVEVELATRGGEPAAWLRYFEHLVVNPHRELMVAAIEGAVVGFGAIAELPVAPDGPAGHFLGGLTVDPQYRRRGIGHRLTADRLDRIWERADAAWYFTNADNAASLALHAGFGFAEVARRRSIHGVTFDSGAGVLLSAPRPPRR